MTGASENGYLVRVRAQVMCRDEGTGGWMALGGGGLADVMVGKRLVSPSATTGGEDGVSDDTSPAHSQAPSHEYYIHGKRISDNMNVLECTIKKDFMYNKVMPTFHHWVTDEKRFGLTFQTAADARAFDKGVRIAVEELLDDLCGVWSSSHYDYKQQKPVPKDEDEEQNIFECLDLPGESRPHQSHSVCGGSEAQSSRVLEGEPSSRRRPTPGDITQTPILSAITLPNHPFAESLKQFEAQYEEKVNTDEDFDKPRYVHLSAVHEYTYPQMRPGGGYSSEKSSPNTKPPLLKRDSGSIKTSSYSAPPPLPEKKPPDHFQARLKCRYCDEWYLESGNRAGSCEFAPDCFKSCVETVSCIKCAQGMLYHCMSDGEGDFAMRPCACSPVDHACAKRWSGVALLSLVVPCLCCYVPLRCVHRAACAASLAGGVHAPLRR